MTKQPIQLLGKEIEKDFLPFVRKPGRYIGGEVNQAKKDLTQCDLTFALCFPDVYEVAMSNTGLSILYHCLNSIEAIAAERVFSPWTDAEEILRQKKLPIFTLESKAALKNFDVVGFSLSNELCYTNVLNILDLSDIPLRSADRTESDPIILAGGIMANCCEPVADFIDIFLLGEAEQAIVDLTQHIIAAKKADKDKIAILTEAAKKFPFVYVPQLYEFQYDSDKITSFKPKIPGIPTQFENAIVEDFNTAPVPPSPIVPFTKPVHERISIEIMRGCPNRCRFCQASFCRRPVRFRSVERIVEIAKQNYHATGFNTISLLSLSTADYPDLEELITGLNEYFYPKYVGISVPSLRVDKQLQLLPKLTTSVRKSGLTIAVEAASEKLRIVINKPIKDTDLFAAVEAAYEAGYQKLKLYFMTGLPGETEDDIKQIVHLASDLAKLRKKVAKRVANINVAVSCLVPKPHTPLAWLGQQSREHLEKAKQLILDEKRKLNATFLNFKFHDIDRSLLETAMARGDRRYSNIIEAAWRRGARFDLWNECFDYNIWQQAFGESNLDIESAAQKQFDPEEILPWQHLTSLKKQYLLDHYNSAIEAAR